MRSERRRVKEIPLTNRIIQIVGFEGSFSVGVVILKVGQGHLEKIGYFWYRLQTRWRFIVMVPTAFSRHGVMTESPDLNVSQLETCPAILSITIGT